MSIEAVAIVLHHSKAKGTAKLVLVGIANHAGDGGAWPAIATLAKYANVHERNVQRAIDALVSKGEVRVLTQDGGDRYTADHRRPNRYEVLVTCPPWCDRTSNHRDTRRLAGEQLRVATAPPQSADGVATAPPAPVATAPPEPYSEPATPSPVPTGASTRARPCAECSAPTELVCRERQRKLAAEDRHAYIENVRLVHAR